MRAERLGESWRTGGATSPPKRSSSSPTCWTASPSKATRSPIGFVCEWPGRGIAESRAEIDAVSILQAAGRAVTLWSDE
jgi:hypothetical protein